MRKEIKKNLEDLFKLMLHEGDLQRTSIVSKALDLIKRKDVEIERLNIELQSMRSAANSYKMHYETDQLDHFLLFYAFVLRQIRLRFCRFLISLSSLTA